MRLSNIARKWLPPPRLLRISGLGVDVSESSIKYIGFESNRSSLFSLKLSKYGEVSVENALSKGEVTDVATFAKALAEVRGRTGIPYMHISLPEERVYVFETEIESGLTKAEIRQQLEFRLEENVPLSPRDAYFDFEVIDWVPKDEALSAVVTVCSKELVDTYYEACRLAEVTPLSFEVESAAIARAVLPRTDRGTRVLLDFGKTRTGFGIVHNGHLLYTSTIEVGGDDLSAALVRHLGEKPVSELLSIRNHSGLVKGVGGRDASEILLPIVSSIKDEVSVRMQYWNNKNGASRPIDHIIVSGGSANLRGLPAYLSETLGVEATLADVWQNAFDPKLLAPAIDRRRSYGFATAIGLGLTSYLNR